MSDSSWFLHIFEVSDVHAQEVIAKSLQDVDSVVVEPRTCGADSYVIIGGAEPGLAKPILRTVLNIDPEATLLHCAQGHDPATLWPEDHPADV
jgi:hypothetical protein